MQALPISCPRTLDENDRILPRTLVSANPLSIPLSIFCVLFRFCFLCSEEDHVAH